MSSRFLACFLSFSLLISSVPPEVFSQMRGAPQPGAGGFLPGGTFSSGLELYRWMSSFPEFSRNPAFSAQVLIAAAPLIQKGPVKASLEGNRIVLASDRSDFEPLYIELPGTGGPVSQSAALLARELQRAQGTDKKEGGVGHSSRVLSRFFESFSRPAPESGALPVKASVSEGSSPAPEDPKKDVWTGLESWIAESLYLTVDEGRTREWKNKTIEILRGHPGMALTSALAQAFEKAHPSVRVRRRDLENLLEGKLLSGGLSVDHVYQVALIDGRYYAATKEGIYVKEGGQWRAEPGGTGWVLEVAKIDGKLYAAAEKGIYVKQGERWRPELSKRGRVFQILKAKGRLYAATDAGLYEKTGGRWKPASVRMGAVREIMEEDGKLYVSAEKGIYLKEGAGWSLKHPGLKRPALLKTDGKLYAADEQDLYVWDGRRWNYAIPDDLGWIRQLVEIDGQAYVATKRGIYAKQGDRWVREALEPAEEWILRIVKIGDRTYAATAKGLYRRTNGRWIKEPLDARWVHGVFEIDGGVYLSTDNGLVRRVSLPGNLKGWQGRLLMEVGREIDRQTRQKSLNPPAVSEPLPANGEGGILGEDGQTLFSGFQKVSALVMGLLGAGILEGLSRLALFLGNLNLGFAQAQAPAPVPAPHGDIWLSLERWIYEGLELKASGKAEEWKKATAEILRNDPALPLEKALSMGLAQTHALGPEMREEAELFLSSEGTRRRLKNITIRSVDKIGDAVYLRAEKGLYRLEGDRPVPVLTKEVGVVDEVVRIGDAVYARADKGLYRLKESRAEPVLTNAGRIHKIDPIGDAVYVRADKGLYKINGGRAVPVKKSGPIRGIVPIGDEVYVFAGPGLYRIKGGRAAPVLTDAGEVHEIARLGDTVYAGAEKGFYKIKDGRAVRALRSAGKVHFFAQIKDAVYVHIGERLYKLQESRAELMLAKAGPVREITRIGDILYADAEKGLYKIDGSRAVRVRKKIGDEGYTLTQVGDSVYASAKRALFRIKGGRAVLVLSAAEPVGRITLLGDEAYVQAWDELYRLKGDRAIPVLMNAGEVYEVARIENKVYVLAEKGLYEIKGGRAEPLVKGVEVREIKGWDGRLYLSTTGKGLWIRSPLPENLKNWRETVLEDISSAIEEMRQVPGTAPVEEPFKTDGQGNILGEDGRALFSGFKRGANVLLAILGAGALEGLSRLAMSLGNLSLGFGKEAGEPESSGADVWRALEGRILSSPRAGWNLRPGRLEKWKEATAEILRNNPGLALTRALAKAFAKVYSPPEPVIGPGGLALSELGALSPVIKELYGRLYAAADNALYVKKGKDWSLALDRPVRRLFSMGGRIYAIGKREVYVEKGGVFEPVLQTSKPIEMFFLSRGKLYLGTSNRAYAVKDGRPESELGSAFFRQFWMFKGKAYAVAQEGVYAEEEGKWKRVLKGNFSELIESEKGIYALGSQVYFFQEKTGWKRIWDEKDGYFLFQKAAVINGRLHLVTGPSLKSDYRLIVEKDDQGPETVFTSKSSIRDFWRINGRLYVRTDGGLYRQRLGRWEHKEGFVEQVFELNGKVYALINRTLYEEKEGRWERVRGVEGVFRWMNTIRLGGKTYVIAQEGPHLISQPATQDLYVLDKKGGWTRALERHDQIRLVRIEEETYAMTDRGLYAEKGGQWKNVLPKEGTIYQAGTVYQAVRIDGRVYAASDHGLYAKREGRWIPVVEGLSVRRVTKLKGVLYLESDRGIFKTNLMLENWEKPLLEDLTPLIERMQKENQPREGPAPSEIRPDEKGNILGEDGRTLFSGLRTVKSLAFGLLSAGILESLSRLAVSLGNLSLGLGEEAEPAPRSFLPQISSSSASEEADPWPVLESWLRRELGLEGSGRIEEWKKETAEVLRNDPSLSLQKALARAFGKAYALTPQKAQEADFLFSGERFRTLIPKSEIGAVHQIKVIGGKIYAAAENGLFIYDPQVGRWDQAPIRGQIYSVSEIDGKLYACGDEGLYLKGKSSWGVIFPKSQTGTVHCIVKLGGKLYLATKMGLYARGNGIWEPILSGKSVIEVVENGGKIYAAGFDTVYEQKKPTGIRRFLAKFVHWSFLWKRISMPWSFFGLWAVDGNLYSAKGQAGIFIWEGGTWKGFFAPLGGAGMVSDFAKIGDKFYVASQKGLFEGDGRGNWRHILASASRIANLEERLYLARPDGLTQWILPPKDFGDWQEKILQEIGLRIGRAQNPEQSPEAAKGRPFSVDSQGNILGEDGRTIFSGFPKKTP